MVLGRVSRPQKKQISGLLALVALFLLVFIPPLSAQEITDEEITRAVEAALGRDDMVPANLIHVDTNEGIVTLSGSVENLLASNRAAKLAETVRGVQAVINRIQVIPLDRTDEEIRDDVKQAFKYDPATDPAKVDVTVKDGVVTLSGTLASRAEKQLYTLVAEGVKGVRRISDRISVKPQPSRPDSEIKAEIEQRLRFDVWVNASFIEVKVKDGKVALVGMVGSAAEKKRARDDAWVAGVKSVDIANLDVDRFLRDELREKPKPEGLPAQEIADLIQRAFAHDPRVAPFNIQVEADNGVVTLTGVVDNLKAKRVLEQDAMGVEGVSRVKNNVKVNPRIEFTDSMVQKRVKEALLRDPFLEQQDIKVRVAKGVVHLEGTVEYPFQKMRADEVASRIEGVIDVVNNLIPEKGRS